MQKIKKNLLLISILFFLLFLYFLSYRVYGQEFCKIDNFRNFNLEQNLNYDFKLFFNFNFDLNFNFTFNFYPLCINFKPFYNFFFLNKNYTLLDEKFIYFNNIYFINFNLFSGLNYKSQSNKESKLRRAEIIFFISIPFIYIYFRELMRLNNYLLYGDFDREWSKQQKVLMYITFIIFGVDFVLNDLKG
jgi:hypothetical protein